MSRVSRAAFSYLVMSALFLAPFYYVIFLGVASMTGPADEELRAQAWAEPGLWSNASCEVITAGVAFRGNCKHGRTGETFVEDLQAQDVEVGECPGMHWCADIGDVCKCDGRVTLAATEYGSYSIKRDYESPSSHAQSIDLNGTDTDVQCDFISPHAPFRGDPAPFYPKACFCTPLAILKAMDGAIAQRLVPADGTEPHSYSCAQQALLEYTRPTGGLPAMAGPRGKTPGVSTKDLEKALREEGDIELLEYRADYFTVNKDPSPRSKLCQKIFEPWALVAASSTNEKGQMVTALRCAYNGVPFASRTSSLSTAAALVTSWKNVATRSCSVRHALTSGGIDQCSVALEDVKQLEDEEATSRVWSAVLLLGFSSITLLFTYACVGPVIQQICRGGTAHAEEEPLLEG